MLQVNVILKIYQTFNLSYNLTLAISRVMIGRLLIFAHPRDQPAVTRFKNVRLLNIRRGKKLILQLSHRQPPKDKVNKADFRKSCKNVKIVHGHHLTYKRKKDG